MLDEALHTPFHGLCLARNCGHLERLSSFSLPSVHFHDRSFFRAWPTFPNYLCDRFRRGFLFVTAVTIFRRFFSGRSLFTVPLRSSLKSQPADAVRRSRVLKTFLAELCASLILLFHFTFDENMN